MKIINFFILGVSAVIPHLSVEGQILYTDLIPDSTTYVGMQDSSNFVQVDINQDGLSDFTFVVYHDYEFHSPSCCHFFLSGISVIDTNSRIGLDYTSTAPCFPALLDSGDLIDNSLSWGKSTYINFNQFMFGCPGIVNSLKFYPVKLYLNGNYHFGWIRLFTTVNYPPFGSTYFIVYDMALNLDPGQAIFAGQNLTGLTENSSENQLLLYPNPSNGVFDIIISDKNTGKWNLSVYNTLGKLIQHREINSIYNINSISISNAPDGLYHLILTNGRLNYHAKLIINNL